MKRSLLPWLTAVLVIALDRITKMMLIDRLPEGGYLPIFPGFAITHVHNRGIAFSMFADGGWLSRVLIHAVIFSAVVLIAWMLVRQQHRGMMAPLGFGLILGGAIGNLIDRVIYGWVVDFLHLWVKLGGRVWSWPDFNLADSAITVGAAILILHELRTPRPADETATDDDAPDPA